VLQYGRVDIMGYTDMLVSARMTELMDSQQQKLLPSSSSSIYFHIDLRFDISASRKTYY